MSDAFEKLRHRVSGAMDDLGDVATDEAVRDGRWDSAFADAWREIDALVDARSATLRHHAEGLAEAGQAAHDAMLSWFSGEYANHPIAEALAEKLRAWREGPGAETKGGGNG